jgi:hypothetical protein
MTQNKAFANKMVGLGCIEMIVDALKSSNGFQPFDFCCWLEQMFG